MWYARAVAALLLIGSWGCDGPLFLGEGLLVVEVEREELIPGEDGLVEVPVRLANEGLGPVYTRGCVRQPGDLGVNWSLERWEEGEWKGRESGAVLCAPPTFGDLTLKPGEELLITPRWALAPGKYRLRAFFRRTDDGPWILSPPPQPFIVAEEE